MFLMESARFLLLCGSNIITGRNVFGVGANIFTSPKAICLKMLFPLLFLTGKYHKTIYIFIYGYLHFGDNPQYFSCGSYIQRTLLR